MRVEHAPARGEPGLWVETWAALASQDVHLWRAPLDPGPAALAQLEACLSSDEGEQARRFRFPRDRESFIAAHGFLRLLLSRYLGIGPGEIRFAGEASRKPRLAGAAAGNLRFNLSHSDGVALFAVTRGREVGVDIERIQPGFAWEGLSLRYFSVPERSALAALAHERRSRAGYEIWTRKEAWLKAMGTGLTIDLEDFDVTTLPDEPVWVGRSARPTSASLPWTLLSVEAGDAYAAAVAVEGRQIAVSPVAPLGLSP